MGFTLVIVPGLRDEAPQHWQTHLAQRVPGSRTVPPMGRDQLDRDERVAALQSELDRIEGPVVLAAHSAGCITVAHWAARHDRPILGALLAAPADMETPMPEGYPNIDDLRDNGWLPMPRARLPFGSIVAASRNDPLGSIGRIAELARDWGSRIVDVGAVGHLNPASGFGEWPRAEELIRDLVRRESTAASSAS